MAGTTVPYCFMLMPLDAAVDACSAVKYVTALYWTVSTLGTVGYGDVHIISTKERVRRPFCVGSLPVAGRVPPTHTQSCTHARTHACMKKLILPPCRRHRAPLACKLNETFLLPPAALPPQALTLVLLPPLPHPSCNRRAQPGPTAPPCPSPGHRHFDHLAGPDRFCFLRIVCVQARGSYGWPRIQGPKEAAGARACAAWVNRAQLPWAGLMVAGTRCQCRWCVQSSRSAPMACAHAPFCCSLVRPDRGRRSGWLVESLPPHLLRDL
jgi:hypothetical protein